ncbi:bifunctional metallophosphatase/5'-nucleotidase [Parashewanella tropica]|uniref:bifunctional metallophosphatase/5'-nucleotidase n=1 Tax=Parashewanella tropica TaxID=2547970 RepID=UPI001059D23E|nr:bifunctional metallophosphatase/5'-nucleotidase [Parashewanella tropica]
MKNHLFKVTAVAIACAVLFGCGGHKHHHNSGPVNPSEPFSLDVIHINDLHSKVDGVEGKFKMGSAADSPTYYTTFGGYPRIAQQIGNDLDAASKAKENAVVLNGGDAFQGSIYFQLNKGAANADLLKNMKIDAMVVGNHEFDEKTPALKTFADGVASSFPLLAANMDISKDAGLKGTTNIKPYQLFAFKDGAKRKIDNASDAQSGETVVAVIGVVLEDMATNWAKGDTGDVAFSSEIDTTQKTIDDLKAKGVNKIVVLSHIGLGQDIELAQGTTGIDLIVGGHSHDLLGDFTNIGLSKNEDYAQLISQKTGDAKTCIVQAGVDSQAVGEVKVKFDKDGNVDTCTGNNTLLTDDTFYTAEGRFDKNKVTDAVKANIENFISGLTLKDLAVVPESKDLRDMITSKYKDAYTKALGSVAVNVTNGINHVRRPGDSGSDTHGSRVAPLVGQSFINWANTPAVQTALGTRKIDVALVAAGGVRQSINAGALYEGNISLELIPFKNRLSVVSVTGAQLKALLTAAVTPALVPTAHAGKFPYVAGMRYTFTKSANNDSKGNPQGSVTQADINTGTDDAPTWVAVADDTRYNVILDSYHANGGDGWDIIAQNQVDDSALNRRDLYMDGDAVKAATVTMTKTGDDFKTTGEPDCAPDTVKCNTDAIAFTAYAEGLKAANKELVALKQITTTLAPAPSE